MNTIQKGIVTLIKSSITGQSLALPEDFRLVEAEKLIRRHHMAVLLYDGALRCGIPRSEATMGMMFQAYCKAYLVNEAQMGELQRIFREFDNRGIEYMPMKGCRMKALYPKPEIRTMGDADVLIHMEQYETIAEIVESMGFHQGVETDYELVWENARLHLELHRGLVSESNTKFHAYFGDGWCLAKEKEGTRYAMTPEDEWIYLFTHFTKHYQEGGMGCRHVADLWVYLRANPDMQEDYIRQELEKLGLAEFHQNIRRLIRFWFEDGDSDDKIEYISEFIFSSGSWGRMESQILARGLRDMKRTRILSNGKLVYFLKTAFPGVNRLKEKYTILKKAPWLLPVVWLVRPFYKLLAERGSLAKNRKAVELLTEENIENYRQMMGYVGLREN